MYSRKCTFFIGLAMLLLALSAGAQDYPRNIILFIGDGMGVSQISALKLSQDKAHLDRFPSAGFVLTQSATHFITESAAGATALSTGQRTFNNAVAMDETKRPLQTVAEYAKALGKSVGLVATSSITHATPAAFAAHVESRAMEFEIARHIASSNIDVLIGGGKKFFLPAASGGARSDETNLVDDLVGKGYHVGFMHEDALKTANRLVLLLADEELPKARDRSYGLVDLVRKALSILRTNPNGFFLMVEGSQIDWAGHANDFEYLLGEMRDFDKAVGLGLDFAEEVPGTLVIATADHETGGLSLFGRSPDGRDMSAKWSTGDHTASMVPLFASGPGSMFLGGIRRNDEVGKLLFKLVAGQ